MPEFYSEHNLRRHFNAPNFTRTRHRFRGARESEKVNLEINQTYNAIHALYEELAAFQTSFRERATLLLEGGATGVTDGSGPVELVGIEALSSRIDAIRRKVKALEA